MTLLSSDEGIAIAVDCFIELFLVDCLKCVAGVDLAALACVARRGTVV